MTDYEPRRQESVESELFRLLVENVTEFAIFVVDPHGRVKIWNRGAERLLGYREDEVIGQSIEKFLTADDIERGVLQQEMNDAQTKGRGVDERWYVRNDGSQFWAGGTMIPLWNENGMILGYAKIMRDRTEWKLAMESQQKHDARRMAILETAIDAVISIDHEGRITEFNAAAEKLFGYAKSDAHGHNIAELIIPPHLRDAHRKGMARFLSTGEGPVLGKRLEMPSLHADGRKLLVELSITRVSTDGPPLFTAFLRDITERRRIEQHRITRLAVTEVLSSASTVSEAVIGVLQEACQNGEWATGLFWTVDSEANLLRCRETWNNANTRTMDFVEICKQFTFAPTVGLPGRVWATGKHAWITDLQQDLNFPRIVNASNCGLRSAFACPVVVGNQTLGAIEFFSADVRQPDAHLLELMSTICGQIGRFIVHKEAEERLRQSEQRFARFMQHLPGLAWIKDLEGRYIFVNNAAEKAFGKPWDLLNGKTDDEVFPAYTAADFRRNDQSAISSGMGVQVIEALEQDHGVIHYSLVSKFPILGADGAPTLVGGIAIDITEQRRMEHALQESERLYRAIGESIDFGIWVCDHDGRNIYASESFLQLVGLTQAQCSSFGWSEVLHPDDAELTIAAWKECIRTGGQWDVEHRFLGIDGQWHPVLARGVPVKNEHGIITAWAGINLDISRLKEAENELREAHRRKDEFLATLAHELRNPLAPISNSLQILKMQPLSPEMAQQTRELMERQVQHLVRLVDDLLDVSRVMRGKIELRKEPVQLATIIARAIETAQPLITEQAHQLQVSLPSESLLLNADAVRLSQVVGNLLTNSAKYTEVNGHIWLTVERKNDHAVLTIRDDGIGIASDMLPSIFDLFVQVDHSVNRAQGGLGIGLTLVKNLVEMHGGAVYALSDGLGTGSEFIVNLPLSDQNHDEQLEQDQVDFPGMPPVSGNRLLIVDDNKDAANTFAMLLKILGHETRVAHDGASALALAKSYRPEMIFLDIGMPGMDGYEVARKLRTDSDLSEVVLVALTGWGQQKDRQRSAEAGFDHHLVKPLDSQSLDHVLQFLIRKRG